MRFVVSFYAFQKGRYYESDIATDEKGPMSSCFKSVLFLHFFVRKKLEVADAHLVIAHTLHKLLVPRGKVQCQLEGDGCLAQECVEVVFELLLGVLASVYHLKLVELSQDDVAA